MRSKIGTSPSRGPRERGREEEREREGRQRRDKGRLRSMRCCRRLCRCCCCSCCCCLTHCPLSSADPMYSADQIDHRVGSRVGKMGTRRHRSLRHRCAIRAGIAARKEDPQLGRSRSLRQLLIRLIRDTADSRQQGPPAGGWWKKNRQGGSKRLNYAGQAEPSHDDDQRAELAALADP